MSVARRLAAALAVVGAGVLAYAVPASATGDSDGGGYPCIENPTPDDLVGHLDAEAGKATAWAKDGRKVCGDVLLSIYRVPDAWDGSDFPGGRIDPEGKAWPQTLLATDRGTVKGRKKLELEVPVPDCGNLQIDLYVPPEIVTVTAAGHGAQLIKAHLWSVGGPNGSPKECKPEETPTPTPSPSDTPSPTPTPTPTDTPSPTPTPTPTDTPSPTPTPVETTPAAPPPTSGLGAPVPPMLPDTGSDSTVPLLGLGILLLGAGIGLSFLGRRRTA